jgi:hypothetical protein
VTAGVIVRDPRTVVGSTVELTTTRGSGRTSVPPPVIDTVGSMVAEVTSTKLGVVVIDPRETDGFTVEEVTSATALTAKIGSS